jgi:hypothetical protein
VVEVPPKGTEYERVKGLLDREIAYSAALESEFKALVHTLRPFKSGWVQKVCDNAVRSFMGLRKRTSDGMRTP